MIVSKIKKVSASVPTLRVVLLVETIHIIIETIVKWYEYFASKVQYDTTYLVKEKYF